MERGKFRPYPQHYSDSQTGHLLRSDNRIRRIDLQAIRRISARVIGTCNNSFIPPFYVWRLGNKEYLLTFDIIDHIGERIMKNMFANTGPINLLRGWPSPALLPNDLLARGAEAILLNPTLYEDALMYGPDVSMHVLHACIVDLRGHVHVQGSPLLFVLQSSYVFVCRYCIVDSAHNEKNL